MYCPRCANQVVDNQNYCRNCGLKLDIIVDAINDRPRGQFDFETLKRDLRDLGSSIRAGWEEAAAKHTRKLKKTPAPPAPGSAQEWSHEISKAIWSHQFEKALRKMKVAHSRKYSLQQATLSIFGGGDQFGIAPESGDDHSGKDRDVCHRSGSGDPDAVAARIDSGRARRRASDQRNLLRAET
jgi:zinc-ribbon domain